jgi:hypothetical protein
MGLDISVYINVKEVPASEVELDSDGYPVKWDEYEKFYINPHFEGRAEPFKEDAFYKVESPDPDIDFSRSYGGYNTLREQLAELVNLNIHDVWDETITDGPFVELINFSDCEGTIGTVVAAKLAKDFAQHQSKVNNDNEYFVNFYNTLKEIFSIAASNNGVVIFR